MERRDRRRTRPQSVPVTASRAAEVAAAHALTNRLADDSRSSGGRMVVVSDTYWTQLAESAYCEVEGCAARAVPEAYEPTDLEDGDVLDYRLCDEHILAFVRR